MEAINDFDIYLQMFLSHRLFLFGLDAVPPCFLQSFLLTFFPIEFLQLTKTSSDGIEIYMKIKWDPENMYTKALWPSSGRLKDCDQLKF